MNTPSSRRLVVLVSVILILLSSCGGIAPVPTATARIETPTTTKTPTLTPTPTLGPVEHIMAAIWTQAASPPTERPTSPADKNIPMIPIKKRLGKGVVYDLAISPNGKTIAVTGLLTVSMYDFKSFKEIWTASLEQAGPWPPTGAVRWSPDGSQIATLSGIGVSVWDAKTGKRINLFKGHGYEFASIAWGKDGKLIASRLDWNNSRFLIWDVQTGAKLFELDGYDSYAWLPSKNLLALGIGFASKKIVVWDTHANKQLYPPLEVCDKYCSGSMAWSSDGTRLAVNPSLGVVATWDIKTGQQLSLVSPKSDIEP
jgi:WD40 repeat protein